MFDVIQIIAVNLIINTETLNSDNEMLIKYSFRNQNNVSVTSWRAAHLEINRALNHSK